VTEWSLVGSFELDEKKIKVVKWLECNHGMSWSWVWWFKMKKSYNDMHNLVEHANCEHEGEMVVGFMRWNLSYLLHLLMNVW